MRSEYISLVFTFDYSIAWDKAKEKKAVVSICWRDQWKGRVSILITDKLAVQRLLYFDTPCFLLCWMISACHFTPKKLFWGEMPGRAQVTPRMTDRRTARLCSGFVELVNLLNLVISHVIMDKDFRPESVSMPMPGQVRQVCFTVLTTLQIQLQLMS